MSPYQVRKILLTGHLMPLFDISDYDKDFIEAALNLREMELSAKTEESLGYVHQWTSSKENFKFFLENADQIRYRFQILDELPVYSDDSLVLPKLKEIYKFIEDRVGSKWKIDDRAIVVDNIDELNDLFKKSFEPVYWPSFYYIENYGKIYVYIRKNNLPKFLLSLKTYNFQVNYDFSQFSTVIDKLITDRSNISVFGGVIKIDKIKNNININRLRDYIFIWKDAIFIFLDDIAILSDFFSSIFPIIYPEGEELEKLSMYLDSIADLGGNWIKVNGYLELAPP